MRLVLELVGTADKPPASRMFGDGLFSSSESLTGMLSGKEHWVNVSENWDSVLPESSPWLGDDKDLDNELG